MGRIEVALAPGEDAKLLTLDGSHEAADGWTIFHLEPAAGFVGAAAVEGRAVTLSMCELELAGERAR
jgi:4'-phosphopantetheinyl transferase